MTGTWTVGTQDASFRPMRLAGRSDDSASCWEFGDRKDRREEPNHRIHGYPAKLPAFITTVALEYAKRQGVDVRVVADVFCGCGTTAVKAEVLAAPAAEVRREDLRELIAETSVRRWEVLPSTSSSSATPLGTQSQSGRFNERVWEAVAFSVQEGRSRRFDFTKFRVHKFSDLKECRIGRLLHPHHPHLTSIQRRFGLYLLRQGLLRIPEEAIPPPPELVPEAER